MGNQNATAGVPEKEKTAEQVPHQVSASDCDQSSSLGGNDSVVLEKQPSSSAANDHDPAHVDSEASDHAREEEERADQIPEISTSKHDQSSSSGGNDVIVFEKQRSSSAANDYDLSGASDVIKEESYHTKAGGENDEAAAKPSNIEHINQDSAAKPNDSAGGSSLGGGVFDDTRGKETISSESNSDENRQSESFREEDEQIHELSQMVLHVIPTQPAEMHEIKSNRPHQNGNLLESLHDVGEPLGANLTSQGLEENLNANPDSPQKVDGVGSNECLLDAESALDKIGSLNDIMRDKEPLVPPLLTSKSVLRVEETQQELVQTISGKETMSELKNMKDHTSDSDQRQLQPISNGHETEFISQKEVIEKGFQVELSSNVVVDASHVQILEPTNNPSVNPLQNSEEIILVTEYKLKEAENKSEISQTITAEDVEGAMDAKMTPKGQVEEEARGQNGDENTPSYDAGIAVEELQNEGRRNDRVFADAGSHPVEASATINGWHDYDSEPQAVSRQEILGCIEENSEDFCKTSSYKGRREGKAAYEAMNFQPQMNHGQNMEVTETLANQLTSCKEPHKTAAVQSRVHKSPSFNFDIMNIGARISEESDRTPLLYPSNTPQPQVVRSMSSPAVNQNLIVNKEYLTAYQDVSVEKTIIVERSDSEKSKTPLHSLEKEEEIGPVRERHDQNHCSLGGQTEKQTQHASSCNKESALVLRKDRDKRKPRSSTSFFSSCICCAGVNQLNSDF